MNEILIIVPSVLLIILIVIILVNGKRIKNIDISQMNKNMDELLNIKIGEFNTTTKDEFVRNREEYSKSEKAAREELNNSMKLLSDQVFERMKDISRLQKEQLEIFANQLSKLTESNEQKFEALQKKVEEQLKDI
jgi:DNA recombination protein RmuC